MASWAIGSVAMGVPASLSRTTTVYRPSSRAVSASLGASALAGLAVGHANWDTVLLRLGVFLASTIRGKPPQLARQFVEGESAIEEGLLVLLRREGDQLVGLRPVAVGDFLLATRAFWPSVFRGGQRLWAIGIDDLISEALHIKDAELDPGRASELREIASRRRATSAIDELPGVEAPIRVMNLHQIKGRQMDVSLTIRELGEYEPPGDNNRLRRLVYVAVSRARQRAVFLLPRGITGYFAEIARLT